ncbi:hypothetical protein EFK50_08325 [Nocardioides marmoriginsengisoli]|uniref:YCII-related domain-containing protein n=1 Tax=Nocardioides marmoriginsengisoli TaxID=661483 RepID=A0A3N0CJV0_9ACTN|nr:YciI family protein [Nocardioides marmoriginsengisoli]RNL63730.1 hypothetical protein EFK50_08325 [Nocardioides marmoriginsengisoli]
MTQYLLSVIHDWNDLGDVSDEEVQEMFAATGRFNDEIQASGHWVFAGGLEHPSTATVVNGVKGANIVTDGPYLEAKEHLGGFWVIEAADLDEALEIGRRGSMACGGAVEVRPFQGEDGPAGA